MDIKFLEQFYEQVILSQYASYSFDDITWIDHGNLDLDTIAHYFRDNSGKEYVLVFEDFPDSVVFDDGLSHEAILVGGGQSIKFGCDPSFRYVENITGYFTLYKEKY